MTGMDHITSMSSAADQPDVGETFVAGKDKETAQGLLAACRALGVATWNVRTGSRGFIVPNAVYDQYADDTAAAHGI